MTTPDVVHFFDAPTNTFSYVVVDPETRHCAVIDPVLDFDYAAGSTDLSGGNAIIDYIRREELVLEWVIETHVHADHLTCAQHIRKALGGKVAVGEKICVVQNTFGTVFNERPEFQRDGSQFDHLFRDGEQYHIGNLACSAILTPGHTPACMTHIIGDAMFVGDTLFMPDAGTARADFPGGSAETLFESTRRILSYPDHYRIFMCHDYQPNNRELLFETTVGEQRQHNVHVGDGICKQDFVSMREARDKTLDMPRLILPALQVNMRAGHFPPAEDNGIRYLRVPIDYFK